LFQANTPAYFVAASVKKRKRVW